MVKTSPRKRLVQNFTSRFRDISACSAWRGSRPSLEAILGAKVGLVPASDLKPAVRARAERDLLVL